MKTYTLKQLERSVSGSVTGLTPRNPVRIDVRPEDIVVVETAPCSGCRWIIMLDVFSGIVMKVFPDGGLQ